MQSAARCSSDSRARPRVLDAQLRLVAWDWYYGMALNLPGGDKKRNMSWTPDPADTSPHHTWQGRHIVPYPWSPHDLRLLNVPLGRERRDPP